MSFCPRILLVNDDDDGLFLLERAVMREFPGAKIVKSRTAVEALQILKAEPVDAIITDNRMPMMDGTAMVRSIREHDLCTPILMLTGATEAKAAALEAGVSSFVSSGSWDDIRRHIRELLTPGAAG